MLVAVRLGISAAGRSIALVGRAHGTGDGGPELRSAGGQYAIARRRHRHVSSINIAIDGLWPAPERQSRSGVCRASGGYGLCGARCGHRGRRDAAVHLAR